jgi:hypothetical protein
VLTAGTAIALDKFDTHVNIGYTFVGKPAGTQLNNFVNFALAEEYFVNRRLALVGEALVNSGSSPEAVVGGVAPSLGVTPEISSGEMVGKLGFAIESGIASLRLLE